MSSTSLTPQSLKRKLQSSAELLTDLVVDEGEGFSSTASESDSPSTRPAKIKPPSTASATFTSTAVSPRQLMQMKQFYSRPEYNLLRNFPLELLFDPEVLAAKFLHEAALERYLQRRFDHSTSVPVIRKSSLIDALISPSPHTPPIITSAMTASTMSQSQSPPPSALVPLGKPFVRSTPPCISFAAYLERLFRYCHPEPLHLLAVIVYTERLVQRQGRAIPPTGWHRWVVTAWLVAAKALSGDQYWTNQYWARVAGVGVGEIFSLEWEFVHVIFNWNLQITPSELTAAWDMIK